MKRFNKLEVFMVSLLALWLLIAIVKDGVELFLVLYWNFLSL